MYIAPREHAVYLVVFDKRNGIQRRYSCESHMIQIGHIEAAWTVAHSVEHELCRKIECAGASLHSIGIEDPSIDQNAVAIKEFSNGEFPVHRLTVQKRQQKLGGQTFYIVDSIALDVQSPRQSVRRSNQIVEHIGKRFGVNRRYFSPEGEIITRWATESGIRAQIATFGGPRMVLCHQPVGARPYPDRRPIRWPAERPQSVAAARGFRT
jgi:hypothetical protein